MSNWFDLPYFTFWVRFPKTPRMQQRGYYPYQTKRFPKNAGSVQDRLDLEMAHKVASWGIAT
jgi:hypothetical protein